jgi:peroxiredoxin
MRIHHLKVIITGFILLQNLMNEAAWAQQTSKPTVQASAESPVAFDLANQTGKTVLIFHWRTTCAVCLDKMDELRKNITGWKNKPFVVLAVNHDKSRQEYLNYLKITRTIHGDNPQLVHIYSKDLVTDNLYANTTLPISFAIDDKQVLRHTYIGRIPAQAWDDIADLLP